MAAITTNINTLTPPGNFNPWPGPAAAAAVYDQKVWDSGTVGWCYYSEAVVNPTPLAGATTPNWSGVISNPIVIGVR